MRHHTKTLTLVLVAILSLAATNAFAWGCRGGGGYGWHGGQRGMGHGMSRAVDSGSYDVFMQDTRQLRAELAADRAVLNAEMVQPEPDTQKVEALHESISEKESRLAEQARAHNVTYSGRGYGRGWNCGVHGHDHAFGRCW